MNEAREEYWVAKKPDSDTVSTLPSKSNCHARSIGPSPIVRYAMYAPSAARA